MLVYGIGFVCSMCVAVFCWLKVDMGIEGDIGALFFLGCALISGVFMLRKTYEFVRLGNILGWLI